MNTTSSRRHSARYRRIARVLERHGLGIALGIAGMGGWVPFHRGLLGHSLRDAPYTTPEHLRLALEELGPTFIKLGQLLSTRADLLPAEYIAELVKLQDAAPPSEWEAIRTVIREELGDEPEKVFAEFDARPLASASIGQAYAAVLGDGTRVVVKVRRPGAVEQVEEDLEILTELAKAAQRRSETARHYDLPGLVEQFSRTLRDELDYVKEARNAERFAADFASSPHIVIPRVFWQTTTPRVLTLERMEGIRIDDIPALDAAQVDRPGLARRGADLVLTMVFDHRFFHGDPHAGNMFVYPDGSLALIDFGMVGTLSEEVADELATMLLAFTEGDLDALGSSLRTLSGTRPTGDDDELRRSLADLVSAYRDRPLAEIPIAEMIERLLGILRRHRLGLPHETALLFKVLVMAEGLGARLDSAFKLGDALTAFSERLIERRFSIANLARRWSQASADAAALLPEIPGVLRRLRRTLDTDGFEVHLRAAELDPLVARAERIGNRLVAGVIAAALINGIGGLVRGDARWRSREGVMVGVGLTSVAGLVGYLLWTLRRPR